MKRLKLFALLAAGCVVVPAGAEGPARISGLTTEQYYFDTVGMELGLPGMVAHTALQTRDGYLWLGTQEGLRRFDGVRFVPFRASNAPGFVGHVVRCLSEDRDGNLWVGTDAGALIYRDGGFETIELPKVGVTAIAQDRQGRVWLGTSGQGLYFWQSGKLQVYDRGPALPSASIRCLYVDRSDRLWIGFEQSEGVVCLEGGAPRYFREVDGRPMGDVLTICELPKGTMWFGTLSHGLLRLENDKFTRYGPWRGLAAMQVTDLQPAKDGGLWVAANRLQKITDLQDFAVETIERVPSENVRTICEDREGNVWLSAQAEGLIRMRQMPYRSISTEDGLPGNGVKTVSQDKAGNLWLAVQRRGVVKLGSDGKVVTYAEKEGFPDDDPALAYAANDGSVWVGAGGKVCVLRDGQATAFPNMSLLRGAYEDRRGVLWLGTEEPGLMQYQNGTFTQVKREDGRPIPYATSFCEDAAGALYVGTWRDGLYKIEGSHVTVFDRNNGLPTNDVRAVHIDQEGRLWVGLRNRGLAVLHEGRWLNPDALSEAMADNVSAITEDEHGQLWLGTLAGVMWAPKAALYAAAQGKAPMPKMQFVGTGVSSRTASVWSGSQPVAAKTPDGTLMFATRRGLLAIDPHRLPFNQVVPPVHIEAVAADGSLLDLKTALAVPAGTREIKIEYAAPSFVQTNLVFFRYKLEGYDRDWVEAGTRRTAYYTHLPPRAYVFRVKACNGDGVWNEAGARIQLVQLPHFYETWWFYGLAFATATAAAVAGDRWRTAMLRRENEKLNRLVNERTRELELASTAKSEFLESVSHEIRNPLNGLNGLLGLLKRETLDARARELMHSLQACARNLTRVFEDVLSHSKLEYSHLELSQKSFSLPELLREVAQAFAWQAEQQGNRIRVEVAAGAPERFEGDEDKIKTIVSNFVGNAIKYAPGSPIEIKAESHPLESGLIDVHLEVHDSGPGISAEEQKLIFKKFVRGADAKNKRVAGTGLGLATCRVLARALGGSVGVDSERGKGSTFYVRLPLRPTRHDPAKSPEAKRSGRTPTILVIEDEHYNQVVLKGIAVELGCAPAVASTGEQARMLLEQGEFDVIFLDWELPDTKGREIARWVRARPGGEKPLIVAVTAHDSEEIRRQCREAGMDHFIHKPFDAEQVRGLLAGRLEWPAWPAPTRVEGDASAPHPTLNLRALELYARGASSGSEDAVAHFIAALDRELAGLERAIEKADRAELARGAHRAHALGGLFGAAAFCAAARQLETLPRGAARDDCQRGFAVLEAAATVLKAQLRAVTFDVSPRG